MRKKLCLAITLVMLLFSGYATTNGSAALFGPVTITVSDDTHVDSTNADSALGEQQYLDIESWGDSSLSYHQIIWLKFSLSSVPEGVEFTQVTLQVYAWLIGGTFNVTAHYSSDSSWTESTLTYSNMPSYDANPIDKLEVSADEQWYSWNVIDAVQRASDNNLQTVTIVLNEPMLSYQNSVFMYSKETPSLVMDVSPILTLSWSDTSMNTPTPTTTPSPTLAPPTPTSTSTPTPTASGEPANWTILSILFLVIIVITVVTVYLIIKRKGKQPPIPPPPPPPPP